MGARQLVGQAFSKQMAARASARLLLIAVISAAITAAHCQRGETDGPLIEGHAVVEDGDSLSIGMAAIRLVGIDAPELGQPCTGRAGVAWACGLEAKEKLSRRIGGKPVSCRQIRIDRYDRIVAKCSAADGGDLGATMVASGFALPNGGDPRYVQEERLARNAGAGMWSGSFLIPWEWRARNLENEDGCC